jgi:hypothetical protein
MCVLIKRVELGVAGSFSITLLADDRKTAGSGILDQSLSFSSSHIYPVRSGSALPE